MKAHRFGIYGPVCGARDGVNAADMEPPEITCRRCKHAREGVDYWQGSFGYSFYRTRPIVERQRDGRLFVAGPWTGRAPFDFDRMLAEAIARA